MTTTVARPPGARPSAPETTSVTFTHRQIMTILAGLMLGILLAALDQTIVSTAIRTISDDLNGLNLQAWGTTAYLVTATISTPLYGKMSDLYGRKPLLLTAISIFIIGSVLCTISRSMYELAAFRAVQGIGAGGLMSLSLAVLGDIVPPRERARYQGYFLAVFGAASVVGPLLGGAFAGADSLFGITGWRWVFLVNVPVAAAALIVVARVLNLPHTPRAHRIDWPGALALSIGVAPLLLVAEQGQSWGWGSGRALACYLVGAAGLAAFIAAERWIGDDALLPLRLFRGSVFSVTAAAGLVIGMGMFGGIVLIPQYLQIVKGASPTEAGLLLLPLMAGIMVASVTSGQLISRTGRYKVFPLAGTGLMVVALLLLSARLSVDTPLWEIDIYMAVFGLGLGGCMQTLILVMQNAVPARDMGVATASSTFFRQMGGTLGVAVFLSILFSTVSGRIVEAFRTIVPTPEFQAALADPAVRANPDNRVVLDAVAAGTTGSGNAGGVLQDSSFLQHIDPRLARPFLVGFADAMDLVFLIAAVVMLAAFVLLFFLKEVPLRTQSGIEARAAELAAEAGAMPVPVPVAPAPAVAPPVSAPREAAAPAAAAPIPGLAPARGPVPAAAAAVPVPPARPVVGPPVAPLFAGGARPGAQAPGGPPGTGGGPAGQDEPTRTPNGPAIFGQVTQRGNTPLTGATLTLTDLAGRQLDRCVTDSGGHYLLSPPAGGSYMVICASPAHQPTAALVAVAGVPVRHDIALSGVGASLSGSVYTAESGQPVDGAVLTLVDIRGDVVSATTTGSGGRFEFADLPPGHYTLTVTARSLQPVARSVELPSSGDVSCEVEMAARVQLIGVVRTASADAPVAEALATLIDADGQVVGATITGPDGRFVFEDLDAGSYTVIAAGYPPVAAEVQLDPGAPTETVITLQAPTLADRASGNGADGTTEGRGDEYDHN